MGHAGPNNWVHAQDSLLDVGDVHRASLTAIRTCDFSKQLRHHRGHIDSLGNTVTVAAMIRCNPVGGLESCADAGGDRLLSYIIMYRTDRYAGLHQPF